MSYENPWIYQEKIFTSDDICDNVGFVYQIYDVFSAKYYLGKKIFFNKRSKPPLKGKKRRRIGRVESDWMQYYGSNQELLDIMQGKDKSMFQRVILHLCKSKSEMSYWETKEIFLQDALIREDYYNSWISARIQKNTLKSLFI